MAVFDLYSKRLAAQNRGPDVFSYDQLPTKLRVQIIQIWEELFGNGFDHHHTVSAWDVIVSVLRKEYGRFALVQSHYAVDRKDELTGFFMHCPIMEALDTVDLSCRVAEGLASAEGFQNRMYGNAANVASEAVDEINARFREAAVGYEFSNKTLVRVDNQFVHSEAVLPALKTLGLDGDYSGAEAEFLKAHEHYRHDDASGVLVECCKSFESIMKAICIRRSWTFNPTDTASKLVAVCFDNGLIPSYWQTHFSGLRSVLESALPTPRNRSGGHGAGTSPANVPIELARYVLHMTASTLLFLVEAEARLA